MAEQNKEHENSNVNRHTTITTVLLLLFIVQLGAISWYSYRTVQKQLEAEKLVAEAENVIEKNYPEMHREVKEYLTTNAPEIAEKISHQAIDHTPQVRKWLEEATARQMRYGLDEATQMSAESFRSFVQDNRSDIQAAFEEIDDVPQDARQMVLNLEDQMGKQFGIEMQKQAKNALSIHRKLNSKLDKLSNGTQLEPKELLERRIVRLLKTFQENKLPESLDAEDLPRLSAK
ncbi:hypothetical protein [uncultured Rubinisphaera sp.]|uniref:hypothetical protein n=1 Tax=uncultured Rubinisphaera sp. TaxID=1678686 RepID=UPI000EC796AB|nr:hypothetical protein [Planctomycetaceae bacterium]|tara:strand:- start:453 stop:1148 length:696 start_codon:yes stop_codon:yes gene_type:complete